MTSATAFAPATVSNVGCGFDVLGFAIDGPGDEVDARLLDPGQPVTIDDIVGDDGRLPRAAARNAAGIAARALLDALGERRGVALTVRKGLPLGSGLGGSAASAAAAVVAVSALVDAHPTPELLVACALEGERLTAGSVHADNIAPAIFGGLVLVRQASPPDVIRLPVPAGLTAVVVHPRLEIETAAARAMLGATVPIAAAIRQSANLGALVDALHRSDFAQLSRTLEDAIAEPRRASLIPGLAAIKRAAIEAGALGAGISGSGPALFALCAARAHAAKVASAMAAAVREATGSDPDRYVSAIAGGARLVSSCAS
ncbi:MAG: homoserine kinase [Betaproteobacteria bacterium]